MLTDEQAAARKAALEREKAGYENNLARAKQDGNSEKVERYQGLIKGVEKALKDFESQGSAGLSMANAKAELLAAAEAAGVEADKSMTKAQILEALENQ